MDRILDVPYFVQPTPITCQSTCLKMFAEYLARKRAMTSMTRGLAIQDIWNEINTGTARPVRGRNSYRNMIWWLGKYFAPTKFSTEKTTDEITAITHVVGRIDSGFPVMVSTNHSRTKGHIIMVIGYEGYLPNQTHRDFGFICHDPYGKFAPQLNSRLYGKRRFTGGACLVAGGQDGPGRAVKYDLAGIRRVRADRHSPDTFFMMSAVTRSPIGACLPR